jgi:PAS domain S-box-containing protein
VTPYDPSFRALADAMPQIVWTARPDGTVDYCSRRWYEYTGLSFEQTERGEWASVIHPDDLPRVIDAWQAAEAAGGPFEIECRFRRAADGAYRWHLCRSLAVRDDATGVLTHWVGTSTDIDDQKRAELELARIGERERRIADTLQGALMPALPDAVPGLDLASFYKAALDEASVGGDFADVFPLDKNCHVLVVGDLSGKGLAAAAQVATVRNMLRYALHTAPSVADAVTRLNDVLLTNRLLTGYATLVVLAYDVSKRTITYVSCGQEPALLRRRADGTVEQLPPTGPVLAAVEGVTFSQRELPIHHRDAFALYTDGLTEAGPTRRDLFGIDGLIGLMRDEPEDARALAERIRAGVDAHARGVYLDDVCLLVGVVTASAANHP